MNATKIEVVIEELVRLLTLVPSGWKGYDEWKATTNTVTAAARVTLGEIDEEIEREARVAQLVEAGL